MIWQVRHRQARQSIMVAGVAGLACLGGCTGPSGAHESAANASAPAFTVQTPIDKIAADERGKAVLVRDVPGVMSNSRYELFSSMSLSQLASLSGGRLTQTKLKQVNADLAELSPGQ